MKTQQWVSQGLPLVLVAMIGLVLWLGNVQQEHAATRIDCPDLVKGCSAMLGEQAIEVGIDVPVRPLKAFNIRLKAPGARRVEARFTMEGMDMGFNLYTLHPDAAGVFRVNATLPVCVTGRRDWVMTLEVDGQRLAVPFVTEL
ncbi:MAG: hypothetical protein AB1899_08395 [Pseudomonadota bacterium]